MSTFFCFSDIAIITLELAGFEGAFGKRIAKNELLEGFMIIVMAYFILSGLKRLVTFTVALS